MSYHFKRYFLSGLLVIVPLVITFIVLESIFLWLDNLSRPILEPYLGFWFLGFGIALTLIFVWIVGILANLLIVKKALAIGEKILYRIPVAKVIYSVVKQLLETFAHSEKQSFKRVVLVEYPEKDIWSVGFVNGELFIPGDDEKKLNILVFAALNPTSGFFILVPEHKTKPINITVEEGLKWVVSGGIVKPKF